jgi:hypothetical protein
MEIYKKIMYRSALVFSVATYLLFFPLAYKINKLGKDSLSEEIIFGAALFSVSAGFWIFAKIWIPFCLKVWPKQLSERVRSVLDLGVPLVLFLAHFMMALIFSIMLIRGVDNISV